MVRESSAVWVGARTLWVVIAAASWGCVASSGSHKEQASAQDEASEKADKAPGGGTGVRHKGAEGMMGAPAKDQNAPSLEATKPAPTGVPLAADGDGYGYIGAKKPADMGGGVGSAPSAAAGGLNVGSGESHLAKSRGVAVLPPGAPLSSLVTALDPNARYATTYRPGGAALAAFDAAVARGSLPADTKDLVGDFGARYAPTLAVPANHAMTFSVDLERSAISPAGGTLNLRIAMKGADAVPSRAPLSVHLVLDVSGSMQGPSIEQAKSAAEKLVERLAATDDFSMVTFSSSAQVIVPDGPIGARRTAVLSEIKKINADGGTNISAGLDLGYAQAHDKSISPDAVRIVMLLSDGHANGGDTSLDGLARRSANAFNDGVQTSTFGLGSDFDARLMSTIAERGAGGYYYLADATQIAPALEKELDARLQPVATGVEVRLRLRPDITPTRVFGSHVLDTNAAALVRAQEVAIDKLEAEKKKIARDRELDAEGGMRFFMPAFARADRHAMMVTVNVPKGVGDHAIGSLEVRMKDRVAGKNVTLEIPIKATHAASDEASAKTIDASVSATTQAFSAGDAIAEAARRVDVSDRAGAFALLSERAALLRKASTLLGQPMLVDDAKRLDRLAAAVSGDHAITDSFQLAVLLRGSAHEYLR